MAITYAWRGAVGNDELNALHAAAFETRVYSTSEWDWVAQLHAHSLGWVTARQGDELVGFVNVITDGAVHAWLQDTMVTAAARGEGIGLGLVAAAREETRRAGCEWLHVDFEPRLAPFYIDACGFVPTSAGLIALR
jgi:GNAT superfamily N-acetyltransferase